MSNKYQKLLFSLSVAVTFLFTGQVAAEAYDNALSSLHRGAYESAQEQFMALAERGHAGAQFELGLMFHRGIGLPQNYEHALKWYRLAASGGDARARNNLGVMYRDGQGVKRSNNIAYMWFSLTASTDDGLGRDNLERLSNNMSSHDILHSQQLAADYIAEIEAPPVAEPQPSLTSLIQSEVTENEQVNPVVPAQEEEFSSREVKGDASVFNFVGEFFSKMLSSN